MFTFVEMNVSCICHDFFTDVVALKGGYFSSANDSTDIFQRDLLCNGTEDNLLQCSEYSSGVRDCPTDHSEDAGIKCNGMYCTLWAEKLHSVWGGLTKYIALIII